MINELAKSNGALRILGGEDLEALLDDFEERWIIRESTSLRFNELKAGLKFLMDEYSVTLRDLGIKIKIPRKIILYKTQQAF